MTIEELYQHKLAGNDKFLDMVPRMPDLRRYAQKVKTVVEFGCRTGNSTAAFLAGGAHVTSYDIEDPQFKCPNDAAHRWVFEKEDAAFGYVDIPDCDLLFIDTVHTGNQVNHELQHVASVKRFIVFHDVKEWGWKGEGGEPGILYAIFRFLRHHWSEWRVCELRADDQWGLLVLERYNAA